MKSSVNGKPDWLRQGESLSTWLLGSCAALVLFALMAITLVDVTGRYLFSAPLSGAFEVTEMMLAALIFLGLPLVTAKGGHVAVDLLDALLPAWLRAVQSLLIDLINVLAFGIFAWVLWELAFKTYRYEDTTSVLEIPYAGLVFMMAFTTSVSTLVLTLKLLYRDENVPSQGAF